MYERVENILKMAETLLILKHFPQVVMVLTVPWQK